MGDDRYLFEDSATDLYRICGEGGEVPDRVAIDALVGGSFVGEFSCSWEHFAEWAAQGRPVPRTDPADDTTNDWALACLVLLALVAWTTLGAFGAYTAITRIW